MKMATVRNELGGLGVIDYGKVSKSLTLRNVCKMIATNYEFGG